MNPNRHHRNQNFNRSAKLKRWPFRLAVFASLATLSVPSAASAQEAGDDVDAPIPGFQTYTRGHSNHENPPERLGGPLTVRAQQEDGVTYFVLPGPRRLDPAVFGTPKQPVGFDPAPFPLLGVPLNKRGKAKDQYTFTKAATPFSNWAESGSGSFTLSVVDATAIDGATTEDTIEFEAKFKDPDGQDFRVVSDQPLAHGVAYPFFGGVVTNHLLHGASGIGSRLMPTEFTYVAFWGLGDVYRGDQRIAEDQLVHVMVTEFVRGQEYRLLSDGEIGHPAAGKTLHLMIPPFKPAPDGLEEAPLKTGFIPFPYVEKHMKAAMEEAQALPEDEKAVRLEELKQVKQVMKHTQQHVQEAMKAGKMNGQPFFHVMFNDFEIEAET